MILHVRTLSSFCSKLYDLSLFHPISHLLSSPSAFRYVLMAEPDHIYLRPMPNFMAGDKPASYNFGLDPARPEVCKIVKR